MDYHSIERMNLLAVSEVDPSVFFAAIYDEIHVYRLNARSDKTLDPIMKLLHPPHETLGPAYDNFSTKEINAIKVGKLGTEEVLASVGSRGDIRVWFTSALDRNPICLTNNESTWGIAMHGPSRLLAVSANSREITIFNFRNGLLSTGDQPKSQLSGTGDYPAQYADVVCRLKDKHEPAQRDRTVLSGHLHNIPNICFSPCGTFLVSCSIDRTCRVWNVHTGEHILTRTVGGFWGWTVCFVSPSSFESVTRTTPTSGRQTTSNHVPTVQANANHETNLLRRNHNFDDTDSASSHELGSFDIGDGDSESPLSEGVRTGHEDTEFSDGYYDENDSLFDIESLSISDDESIATHLLDSDDDADLLDLLEGNGESDENSNHATVDDDAQSQSPKRALPTLPRSITVDGTTITLLRYDLAVSSPPTASFNARNESDRPRIIPSTPFDIIDNDSYSFHPSASFNTHDGIRRPLLFPTFPDAIPQTVSTTTTDTDNLPTDLVLFGTLYDLYLLDPKKRLAQLCCEKRVIHMDSRIPFGHDISDSVNITEWIPDLSLAVVASKNGKVALVRILKLHDENGNEKYFFRVEKRLPASRSTVPLLGIFVSKHDKVSDKSLIHYNLYFVYHDGKMSCYELRKRANDNPLRMDTLMI
ncbi:1215_t:CDS:10 [Paraglomus brasilianum]|uniref:1215_t:CDS:1 n=1 Tax=Paraglomus brasilianum TaxID=144538 RepID=A0A9N8Z8I2_9GLOM|nr:1215_t:CDS:10 [Paraglomus brasilianum]